MGETAYIYIDETGDMLGRSAVGGIVTYLSPADCSNRLSEVVARFNRENSTRFEFPRDMHAHPVMAGQNPYVQGLNVNLRAAFVNAVIAEGKGAAAVRFAAFSEECRFSAEATYQMLLRGALVSAFEQIAGFPGFCSSVAVVIAQRTYWETVEAQTRQKYIPLVRDRTEKLLLAFLDRKYPGFRPSLDQSGISFNLDKAGSHSGLMMADFTMWQVNCDLNKDCSKAKNAGFHVSDSEFAFGEELLEPFLADQCRRLNQEGRVSLSLQLASLGSERDWLHTSEEGIQRLRTMRDGSALQRELDHLLRECSWLIDNRVTSAGSLQRATLILLQLLPAGKTLIAGDLPQYLRQVWIGALLTSYELLLSCYNHTGEAGRQAELAALREQFFQRYRNEIPGTAGDRTRMGLEFIVRSYVRDLNGYDFDVVLSRFAPVVGTYEETAVKPDDLLGEMLGTVGQAHAFMAKGSPAHTRLARSYFERSLDTLVRSEYRAMSFNFLATLCWQAGDPEGACEWMGKHPSYAIGCWNPAQFLQAVKQACAGGQLFDLSNLLRIWALRALKGSIRLSFGDLREVSNRLAAWPDEHPKELLLKWQGVLYAMIGLRLKNPKHFDRAIVLAQQSRELCEKAGFALRSIGLPCIFLQAWCLGASGKVDESKVKLDELEKAIGRLSEEAPGFRVFAESTQAIGKLRLWAADTAAEALYHGVSFLPFYYS